MDDSIRKYLSEIGRKGGSVKSKRKAASSRANGRKSSRVRARTQARKGE